MGKIILSNGDPCTSTLRQEAGEEVQCAWKLVSKG